MSSLQWHLAVDGDDYRGVVNSDGRVWNPDTCLWIGGIDLADPSPDNLIAAYVVSREQEEE